MAASGAAGKFWAQVRDHGRDVRTRTWWLLALCVGLNLLEASLVAAFARGMHPSIAPQASAVAPFGVFGDLRWVSVYHDSWAAVVGELIGVMVVRGTLTGLSISLAWPQGDVPAPGLLATYGRGIGATLLAAVLLVPSVTLLFSTAVVPVSWLFLAAVPAALLVALLVHRAAVRGDWWRRVVTPRAAGWVALSFVVLSIASAAMAALPAAFWPLIAVLSGVFNARAWLGLVRAVVVQEAPRRAVPVGAIAVLVVVACVLGGAVLGFNASRTAAAHQATKNYKPQVSAGARMDVLFVSGYGSAWDGNGLDPLPGDFVEERFSYRGLNAQGEPLPYTSADTAKPVAQLDKMLLAQIVALRAQSERPVAVVAESEGALVAKTALLAEPTPAVTVLVMASPIESPGRVWYPTSDKQGWGVASDEAMRLLSDAFQGVAPIDLSPDNPFLSSLDSQAPVLENAISCPIAGVHQVALLPLADATVTPASEQLPFPTVVVPDFHGGVLGTPEGEKLVREILEDKPLNTGGLLTLADKAISYAATAWQVPALAPSDYPSPRRLGPAGSLSCRQVAGQLRHAIFPAMLP